MEHLIILVCQETTRNICFQELTVHCACQCFWETLNLRVTSRDIRFAFKGCHHCSVDLSVPSILPPWVWVPSTPSTLLSIYIWIVSCGKDENKQKEAHFFKKCLHSQLKFTTQHFSHFERRCTAQKVQQLLVMMKMKRKICSHRMQKS